MVALPACLFVVYCLTAARYSGYKVQSTLARTYTYIDTDTTYIQIHRHIFTQVHTYIQTKPTPADLSFVSLLHSTTVTVELYATALHLTCKLL